MLRVEEYRQEANVLRSAAAKERNESVKAKLLDLANQYDALATKREEFLALREEIRVTAEQRGSG